MAFEFVTPPGYSNQLMTVRDMPNGVYVSYRDRPSELSQLMGSLLLAAAHGGPEELLDDRTETALVTGDPARPGRARYRILIGDYRQDYSALAEQGEQACVDFFNSQRDEHGGAWSTYEEDRAVHLRGYETAPVEEEG